VPDCPENCTYLYDPQRNGYRVIVNCTNPGCVCPVPPILSVGVEPGGVEPGGAQPDDPVEKQCAADSPDTILSFKLSFPTKQSPSVGADWSQVMLSPPADAAETDYRLVSDETLVEITIRNLSQTMPAPGPASAFADDPEPTQFALSIPESVGVGGRWSYQTARLATGSTTGAGSRSVQVDLPGLAGAPGTVPYGIDLTLTFI